MQSEASFCALIILLLVVLGTPILSANDNFIYAGCSPLKNAATGAEVTSLLGALVNSAAFSSYNTFNVSPTGSATVYGLFQCRGDVGDSACHECVSAAVGRLGSTCGGASGAAMQLDGCYVRYDNVSFVGVEDKSVVVDKCGPPAGDDSEILTRKDAVLSRLMGGGQFFRVAAEGRVAGVAQCEQDLSVGGCQDCLSDAVQLLRSHCGSSAWGDMFLAKCYARYSPRYTSPTATGNGSATNEEEVQRDLAILIGLIAGVAILVVFVSFYSRLADRFYRDREGK